VSGFAELCRSERLRAGLAYWRSKACGRLPVRADIDPLDMPRSILPHVMLVDLVGPGRRPRYRLIGCALADRTGLMPVGRFADEALTHAPYRDYIGSLYADAIDHGGPLFARCAHSVPDRPSWLAERLLLPLVGPDGAPAMMLVVQDYEAFGQEGRPPALGRDPVHTVEECRVRLPVLCPRALEPEPA
jgi:hypothetical protein